MTKNWTAEEVREKADQISRQYGGSTVPSMLTAFAERIEADERAASRLDQLA